ncbi:hypothetical protein Bbelb_114910 [Branchiostoma belcheri]|nr:hypothetical protein Bbelb_114910 [Branchiostoma belcheri]
MAGVHTAKLDIMADMLSDQQAQDVNKIKELKYKLIDWIDGVTERTLSEAGKQVSDRSRIRSVRARFGWSLSGGIPADPPGYTADTSGETQGKFLQRSRRLILVFTWLWRCKEKDLCEVSCRSGACDAAGRGRLRARTSRDHLPLITTRTDQYEPCQQSGFPRCLVARAPKRRREIIDEDGGNARASVLHRRRD